LSIKGIAVECIGIPTDGELARSFDIILSLDIPFALVVGLSSSILLAAHLEDVEAPQATRRSQSLQATFRASALFVTMSESSLNLLVGLWPMNLCHFETLTTPRVPRTAAVPSSALLFPPGLIFIECKAELQGISIVFENRLGSSEFELSISNIRSSLSVEQSIEFDLSIGSIEFECLSHTQELLIPMIEKRSLDSPQLVIKSRGR
jgi:hypothetical protein